MLCADHGIVPDGALLHSIDLAPCVAILDKTKFSEAISNVDGLVLAYMDKYEAMFARQSLATSQGQKRKVRF